MPLTQEQFQKARQSGFSTEQIIEFEKKRTGEQENRQFNQEQPQRRLSALGLAGSYGKGVYGAIPKAIREAVYTIGQAPLAPLQGKGYLQAGQEMEQGVSNVVNQIPQARGTIERLAQGIGSFVPFSQFVKPFQVGARAIPALPAIVKSALAGGGYGATQAILNQQPVGPEALETAKQFALYHGAGKMGASLPIPKRLGSALGGGAAGGLTGGEEGAIMGAGLGSMYPSEPIQNEVTTKIAQTVLDNRLKPSKALKKYSNPSRAIVKEGLWGRNFSDLDLKVGDRLSELNQYKDILKTEANNMGVKVDLGKSLQPIFNLKVELEKAPNAHRQEIKMLENYVKDLSARFPEKDNLTLDEAYEFRDILKGLSPLQPFTKTSHAEISNKLRMAYHNVAESITQAKGMSPELKSINKRISDLISAKEAISDASARNPSWFRMLPLPILMGSVLKGGPLGIAAGLGTLAAETTPGATLIGKMMGKKYPNLGK